MIVPDEEIVKRISGRRTCAKCNAMYHVVFEPPKKPGVCDKCGGELYQREDDAEETVRDRLKVYNDATQPLLDYYGRLGLARAGRRSGRTDEVEKRILAAVNGVARRLSEGDSAQIMITIKTPAEIAVMRQASQIVAEILEALAAAVRPGITTEELDKLAEDLTYKKGAKPAFKGYKPGDVVIRNACACRLTTKSSTASRRAAN